MTDVDNLIAAIFHIQIWGIFKILIVSGLFIYMLFSVIIIRQVDLMTGVLRGNLTPSLRVMAVLHLVFALLVLLSALIIL